MTRRTTAETREAVRRWLPGQDRFLLWVAKQGVNAMLNGGHYDSRDYSTDDQVGRILSDIAAQGGLHKVSRGSTGPDGRVYRSKQPMYYTEAAWRAAVAEAARQAETAAGIEKRWARIWDELSARDITPVTERGKAVRLSSASWHQLLHLGLPGPDED